MLKDKIIELKPECVLDIGCRDGSFTSEISEYCGKVVAVDINPDAIEKARKEFSRINIKYQVGDGRCLEFDNAAFDLVYEKDALHHIKEWQTALDEMLRVSSKNVLIEEPFNDGQTEGKRNRIKAQELFLEVEQEAGYSHFMYIPLDTLSDFLKQRGIKFEFEIDTCNKQGTFEEYFEQFEQFASQTKRKDYWIRRLDEFLKEMKGKPLSHSDTLFIVGQVLREPAIDDK
ncbi:MAG: methyltransferase domain-containing protein [candidate division Zixibacteria bacterium]|nr:methyltransferase domain-containing protein [candidate division Zixibacteria bacterium]